MHATPATSQGSGSAPLEMLETMFGKARSERMQSLIAMSSADSVIADGKPALQGVAGNSIVFAEQSIRSAGQAPRRKIFATSFLSEGTREWQMSTWSSTPGRSRGSQGRSARPASVTIDLIGRPLPPHPMQLVHTTLRICCASAVPLSMSRHPKTDRIVPTVDEEGD